MNHSLLKALDLLQVFSATEPSLALTEISRRLRMPKSTVHRILATLASQGFVERVNDELYALGPAIMPLTQAIRVNVEIRDRVATVARALADQHQESVYVAIPDGRGVLYLYAIESSQRLTARTAVGDRAPFHCTGIGKVCLAFMPDDARQRLVAEIDLPVFTTFTIDSRERLENEMIATRNRGYAIDSQEHDLGTYCVAAPFRSADGRLAGAISLSGTDPAIVGERAATLSEHVIEAANQASGRLGYVAPRPSLHGPEPDSQPRWAGRRQEAAT